MGELEPLLGREKAADGQAATVRAERQLTVVFGRIAHDDTKPIRLKRPAGDLAVWADAADDQLVRAQLEDLAQLAAVVVAPEGEVDEGNVEAEKADNRPCPGEKKGETDGSTRRRHDPHQHPESSRRQRAVRHQHRVKEQPRRRRCPRPPPSRRETLHHGRHYNHHHPLEQLAGPAGHRLSAFTAPPAALQSAP